VAAVVAANNVRDQNSPFALGDEITFHDQLSVKGKRVGDEMGSCAIERRLSDPRAASRRHDPRLRGDRAHHRPFRLY
jgi:hypothetical protein